MAVSDTTLMLAVSTLLNYMLLWRSGSWVKRIVADLFFIAIGFAGYLIITTDFPWPLLIVLIAFVDIIFQMFGDW